MNVWLTETEKMPLQNVKDWWAVKNKGCKKTAEKDKNTVRDEVFTLLQFKETWERRMWFLLLKRS